MKMRLLLTKHLKKHEKYGVVDVESLIKNDINITSYSI